jgi:heptosyltransferase-2
MGFKRDMDFQPNREASSRRRQRILVMRYRFIGDTLLTVPFLRHLRAACPSARIDFLAAPQSGELLRDCPYIDNLILFDTTRKHRYENVDPAQPRQSFWSYADLLRKNRYDMAFVLKRSFSSAALAFLAGIPERIGFNTEGRGLLLTRRVPYARDRHEIDCFLDVLRAAGIEEPPTGWDRRLESWPSAQDGQVAEQRLMSINPPHPNPPPPGGRGLSQTSGEKLGQIQNIVLHLTSSNAAKQWPMAEAKKLADWLLSRPDCHIHCLGAASDAPVYKALRAELSGGDAARARLHNHAGALSLTESLAFLARMDLVVGVDSGTLHMAAAAGTPVIALFGPMDERKWAPPDAQVITRPMVCRPCNLSSPCPHAFACMRDLRAEAVIETIALHLERIHD